MSVIDGVINIQWHVLLNEEKDNTYYKSCGQIYMMCWCGLFQDYIHKHWLWFSHSGNIRRAFACLCFLSVQHITHKMLDTTTNIVESDQTLEIRNLVPCLTFFSLGPNKTSPEKWNVLYVLSLTARQMITRHCR